jgi:type I restriction enzyme S subunit
MIPVDQWKEHRLDEIALIQGGGTPRRSEARYFGGTIPWVTPTDLSAIGLVRELDKTKDTLTDVGLENSSAKLIEPGSVLFSSRASIGKVAVTSVPCATNQGFANFTPNRGAVDPWFLAYLLCRYTPDIVALAGKTTFLEVPRKRLKAFKVMLPPLDEQRRIVARIKECMDRVEEIAGLRAEASEEAEYIFRSRCGDIFSNGWPEHAVKDLITEKPSNGIFKRRKDFGDGVLLANVKNLYGDQIIHPSELERVRATPKEIEKYHLEPGDVLVNRSSLKREGTGRSCVFEGHSEPVVFECHIMRVRCDLEKLHPHLFAAFMNSPLGLVRILMLAKTATMTTWNQTDLQSVMVPTPPLELQEGLVEELAKLRAVVDELRTGLGNGELKYMRESILRKAFAGGL